MSSIIRKPKPIYRVTTEFDFDSPYYKYKGYSQISVSYDEEKTWDWAVSVRDRSDILWFLKAKVWVFTRWELHVARMKYRQVRRGLGKEKVRKYRG